MALKKHEFTPKSGNVETYYFYLNPILGYIYSHEQRPNTI